MTRLHLPPDWQLPAAFAQRLGDNAGRQRAMSADGHLLLVLHEPPAAGAPERPGRAYRLNLLAALFVPITALGSVFGMHLAHGLDGWATPAHFWGVVGLGLLVGVILARTIARPPAPAARAGPGPRRPARAPAGTPRT